MNYELLLKATVREAKKKYSPKDLAKELGISLTPQNAADIVKKYLNANVHEAKIKNPKIRNLAALAALLAAGFISAVQAQNEPITVKTPFGTKTYSVKDLKHLQKTDTKTFATIMEMVQKQNDAFSKGLYQRAMGYSTDKAPAGYEKATKGIEELSDEFGNSGRLITYTDGTKELEGDILHGGVSFRKKLEQRGEIAPGGGQYAKAAQ
jgi:uncharacterized protein (DUF697 family)